MANPCPERTLRRIARGRRLRSGSAVSVDVPSPCLRRLPVRGPGWARRWGQSLAARAAESLLSQLRLSARAIPNPHTHALLCVAQDVPRKALLLLLSEWLEFKRRPEAAPWVLVVKCSPANPATPAFALVARFWEHLQALKRQLRVDRAGVYLWTNDLSATDFARLLGNVFGQVTVSLGEGFGGPPALALALGKPLVAPRHTAFSDYLPRGYRYAFATRSAVVRFAGDPLDVYAPGSSWQVPEPLAVAEALTRLATDSPAQCADAIGPASAACCAGARANASAESWRRKSTSWPPGAVAPLAGSPTRCCPDLLDIRQLLQRQHQGLRPLAAVALRLHRQVELVGQRQARQRQVHPLRLVQGDAHVLDEVLDEEARLEVAVDDARPEVVQRPARRRPAADRLAAPSSRSSPAL